MINVYDTTINILHIKIRQNCWLFYTMKHSSAQVQIHTLKIKPEKLNSKFLQMLGTKLNSKVHDTDTPNLHQLTVYWYMILHISIDKSFAAHVRKKLGNIHSHCYCP
jgi:hypothetical protein